MSEVGVSAGDLKNAAEEAAREARPWLERMGRFGFAAKGLVYGIVGALAAQAALGLGGETTDAQGALEKILLAPFGQLLLFVTTIGLLGYAAWRFAQAFFDAERKGTDPEGLWVRAAYAAVGLIYLSLAIYAGDLLFDLPGDDDIGEGAGVNEQGDSTQGWTAWLLEKPLGQWVAGAAGAVIVCSGLFQFYRAVTANFCEKLKVGRMSESQMRWAVRLGRLGFAARGVAFNIIGGFLILAAIRANPGEARGLAGALATLANQPFGPWLLGAVAVGLLAYGAYMLFEARFRRMTVG